MSTASRATSRALTFMSVNLKAGSTYFPIVVGQGKALATEYIPQATAWARDNPAMTAGAVVGGAGLIIAATPVIITSPILAACGFGSGGVVAGTVAAGAQSGIGSVVAGSWFATLQSAAAGGSGAAVANGVVQMGGFMMATAGGGLAWVKAKL